MNREAETSNYPVFTRVLSSRVNYCGSSDYLNLGFVRSACLEKILAEYIFSRKDWQFASLELGINMVGGYSELEVERRVDKFT